ncbi:hypothetical protein [Streptomyces fulvoviolaceus]|uniref:hypothetical protein n=1 Tax=Streptomyces fulvoviolaceus TaxID=285535 RepID=UPI0021C12F11|nr:hypothetical protein [Streptomyces fulvoviolaceus]MCT9077754.1 hypothetical protein [Streptomyces fulvoviolaceus]
MREFLVEITTTVPGGTSQDEVDRRRVAEEELHKRVLGTLPLHPCPPLADAPLASHPGHPARVDAAR